MYLYVNRVSKDILQRAESARVENLLTSVLQMSIIGFQSSKKTFLRFNIATKAILAGFTQLAHPELVDMLLPPH